MCYDCYDPKVIVTCSNHKEPDFKVGSVPADYIPCEVCGRIQDMVSPCALCYATSATSEEMERYLWDYTGD